MLTIVLAAVAAVQSVTTDIPSPMPVPPARAAVTASAPSAPALRAPASDEYIARAKKALDMGDFTEARRQFVMAVALDRDEGRLPVASTFGLAHVLYAQSYNREAAVVLERLANDAQLKGDADTEARALLDAIWLHTDAKQYAPARHVARRLKELLKAPGLSAETRKLVQSAL